MSKIIMILTNRYDPDVRVYKEAKYLVEKGFEVEILCWDRESHYPDKEVEIEEGILIKRFFPPAKYGSGIKQIPSYIKFLNEVKKYLKNIDFDYIHCHDLDGAIVGNAVKKDNTKLIFDMHEFYEVQGSKQKIRRIIRSLVSFIQTKFDFIIYVNPVQIKKIKNINRNKLVYLPNYPEVKNYRDFSKVESSSLKVSYIGAVRQYTELKNLIEASKEQKNIKLSIHGEGVAYKPLKEIAKGYKNVDITGVFKHHQAGKLFSECDVLYAVYPIHTLQNRIAYPVKFFEAIASKTPIIVSKGTVLEDEVIEKNIGFAVDGQNVNEIENLLSYINLNRDVLKDKAESIKIVQNDFHWEAVVKNLDEIYN